MNKLLTIITLLFATQSFAQTEMYAGCVSYHDDRTKDYNEVNKCFGFKRNDWFAMTYHNSNYNQSVWIGKSTNSDLGYGFSTGLTYGLLTGYGGNPVPMVTPKLSFDYGRFGADLHVLPSVVSTLNLRYKFGDYKASRPKPIEANSNYTITYSYGTLGRQYGGSYRVSETFSVSGQFGKGDYETDGTTFDGRIDNTKTLEVKTATIMATWYPFNWHIGLFTGLAYNDTTYTYDYRWSDSVSDSFSMPITIEGYEVATFKKEHFDYVKAEVSWDKVSPVLGFRIGNPWRTNNPLQLYMDIGVMYLNGMEVDVDYSIPPIQNNYILEAVFTKKLNEMAEQYAEEDLEKYKFLPIVNLGVSYRF